MYYNLTVYQALSLAHLIFSLKKKPHKIEIIIIMTYIFHYTCEKIEAWRHILSFTESRLMMGRTRKRRERGKEEKRGGEGGGKAGREGRGGGKGKGRAGEER